MIAQLTFRNKQTIELAFLTSVGLMTDLTDHSLFPVLRRLKFCRDTLSFEPGRVQEVVREIRKLLDKGLPSHGDKDDTHLREALAVVVNNMIRLCYNHRDFSTNINAVIASETGKIKSEIYDTFMNSNDKPNLPLRYRSNHPPWVSLYLKRWLFTHRDTPHPSTKDKQDLTLITGLTREQVSDWMVSTL